MKAGGLLAAAITTALLYGLAFPPWSVEAVAWFCLVPLLVALRSTGTWAALGLAALTGEIASYFVADALPGAVSTYFLQGPIVAWAFALAVWFVTVALYLVVFALLYRALAARFSAAVLPLLTGAAWAAVELARARLFSGTLVLINNPWALFGYTQVGWSPVVQIADITGVYGVGFVLMMVNAALAELWLARRGPAASRRPALLGLGSAAAVTLASLAYGMWSLSGTEPEPSDGRPVPVAIVQGDVALGHLWRSEFYGRNLDIYLKLTFEAFSKGTPAVVFWPESALTFFLEDEPTYRRAIARVLRAGDAQLVVGGPSVVSAEDRTYFNSVFVLSPDGEVQGRYDKEHLLPFSEYFPLRQLDFVRRRFEQVRVFTPGAPEAPLPTRVGPAGILTCNEALMPEVATLRVEQGATYLVNPSNDSWIGEERWARATLDNVSMRAVEQRRYLVRASTSGPSAIVDPWGRVLAHTAHGTRAFLEGSIRPRKARSIYGRLGDAFSVLCAASVAGALALAGRRSGSRRSQTSPNAAIPRSS